MKIKKLQSSEYKLLKLNLIKSKILKKNHTKNKISLNDIEFRFKKALHLIYLYHSSNKKILFVGNPLTINKEISYLLRNTNHIFIPKSTWISGIITNQNSFLKSILKKNNLNYKLSQRVLQLKKKSDLIVIIDKNFESIALKESYFSRVPTIVLNSDLNPFDTFSSYKIPGNFIASKNNLKNNFFYSLLLATLKRSNLMKKHFKTHSKLNLISKVKKIKIK